MFKRLFAALRRKHEVNVASPKDAGNVSVSKEEFTPLKFEKTDEKVELAKESVAEVQETSIAAGVSQTEVQSVSVAIRPDFKFSSVIISNNSFEKYTLHAFDLNYALYTEASDKPEEFVKDVEDKVHELYDVHCAFGRLFNVIKNPNTQVSIGESDTMSMYVVAALQCRNGKCYAQALDKLKEGTSGEGYFSNSVCSVAVSILCASGDLSDAYLLLQYLVLYCQEEISAIFFRRYAQLIMSVEELAKTDIEDLVVSYMQNSSKKSFFIKNTYVPIINVPIGAGIFKSDVEYLKSAAPEEYEHFAIDAEKKCNESGERVFETLLDRLHMEAGGEKKVAEKKEKQEEKIIKKNIDFESNLDGTQYDVVKTISGYVRVLGCAGSGKTYILQQRFLYLVNELGIDPNRILSIYSTKRSAVAMKEKIREIIGITPKFVMTFSEIGNYIVRNEIASIGWRNDYRVINLEDKKQIEELVFLKGDMMGNMRTESPERVLNRIKREKQDSTKAFDYVDYLLSGKDYRTSVCASDATINYARMQYTLQTFDLADLICVPLYLFDKKNDIKEKYADMFDYVMVDDFQDVTEAEYDFALALSSKTNNLLITGDPNQFLFSRDGAKKNLLMNFEKFYDCKTFYLDGSYRCNEAVMNLARKSLKIFPDSGISNASIIGQNDGTVEIREIADDREGIMLLVRDIKKEHDSETNSVAYSDMALVLNCGSDACKFYPQFKKNNIPYQYMLKPSYKQSYEYSLIMSCIRVSIYDNLFDYLNIIDQFFTSCKWDKKLTIAPLNLGTKEERDTYKNAKDNPEGFIKDQFLNPLKKENNPYHDKSEEISRLERKLQMIRDLKKAAQLPTIKDFLERIQILLNESELLKYDEERKAFDEVKNCLNPYLNEEVSSNLKKFIDEAMLANEYDKEFDEDGIKILSPRDMRSEQFKTIFCYKVYYEEEAQAHDRYYESELINPNTKFYSVTTKTAKSLYLYAKE